MAEEIIGDVGVDVTADFNSFERRLRERLKRIAKTVKLLIPVETTTAAATAALKVWVKRQSARVIDISVRISKKSLAAAAAQLKTLTGLTALSNELTNFNNKIQSFFTNLPKIARMTALFTALGSVAVTAIGALAGSLASLGPAVGGLGAAILALPGLLAGFAATLAVIITALKDAPATVRAAGREFAGLREIVSSNFWGPAEAATASFVSQLARQIKAGLGGVAQAIGVNVSALLAALKAALSDDVTAGIFENIRAGAAALLPAMVPLANILKNLLVFGTSLLQGISEWLVDIAIRFDAWLQNAMETGQLNMMLQALGDFLVAVGNALASIGRIINGIAIAALNAGIGGLFAGLENIANIVNSPQFQETLTLFFLGAKLGAEGLLSALGPIGDLLTVLMPTIAGFLSGAGNVLGDIFSALADSLSQPIFQEGLSAFFGGILNFLQPLIPVVPQIAEKFAMLASLAGTLLTVLGPVIATAIEALLPIFGQLLTALDPVIRALGPALQTVITALAPVLDSLLAALMPILDLIVLLLPPIATLIAGLAAGLAPVFEALAPLIARLAEALLPVITLLANLLLPIIEPLLNLLVILIGVALEPLIIAFEVLANVIKFFGPLIEGVFTLLGAIMGTFIALIKGDFAAIGDIWSGVWSGIVDFWNSSIMPFLTGIGQFFSDLWQGVLDFFTSRIDMLKAVLVMVVTFISSRWNALWDGVRQVFENVWNGLGSFIKTIANGILGTIEGFVNGAIRLINGLIGSINSVSGAIGIPAIPKIPLVNLPRLAMGATILPRTGGTAAILGEGGRAESVVDTGLMNRLLRQVLEDFPKQVSALRTTMLGSMGVAGAPGSTVNNTFQNTLQAPPGTDAAQVAQEFVNRLAERVGLS